MKKLFLILTLLAMTVAATAQESTESASSSASGSDINTAIFTSENGLFSVNILSHLGYGFYFVNTQDYLPKKGGSGEFFLNLVQFEFSPVESFGINLSADFLVRHFDSQDEAFYLTSDGYIRASKAIIPAGSQNVNSSITTIGANFPLMLNGYFGNFHIGAGAEAGFTFTGGTEYSYRDGRRHVNVSEDKAKVNRFTYGIIGEMGYSLFNVYFKYYPKSMRLFPAGSVDQSFFTVGLKLGF